MGNNKRVIYTLIFISGFALNIALKWYIDYDTYSKDAIKIRLELEEWKKTKELELDSLSSLLNSIDTQYVAVIKEVKVCVRENKKLTEEAINIANLDSVYSITDNEYKKIQKELRKNFLK